MEQRKEIKSKYKKKNERLKVGTSWLHHKIQETTKKITKTKQDKESEYSKEYQNNIIICHDRNAIINAEKTPVIKIIHILIKSTQ